MVIIKLLLDKFLKIYYNNNIKKKRKEVFQMEKTKYDFMLDNLANRLQMIADKHIEELRKIVEEG